MIKYMLCYIFHLSAEYIFKGEVMVFSSTVFLFIFLPVTYLLYLICKPTAVRNIILIIASLFFYAYGEPMAVFLMIASIIVNYFFGLGMDGKYKKPLLILSVIFNLLMLYVFKYLSFSVSLVNDITGAGIPVPQITLPVGISFFTFQAMSYVIDVYKEPKLKEKNILNIFLYISLFPQLIAGPIVKFSDLADQIKKRSITLEKTTLGIRRFIYGLAKKMLIANTMGQIADAAFNSDVNNMGAGALWIGAAAYTFQIFFDFSGYSDMAIGLGKMFGFEFKENFNYPLAADSMQDFWRKWNISVSTWFKEYVYIPLGGNRKGKLRTGINKCIVFFLTGLWHGANLTFIVWGLMHGMFLLLEQYGIIFFVKGKPEKNILVKIISHIYVILVAMFAFIFFRADSIGAAGAYIGRMFTGFGAEAVFSGSVYSLAFTPYAVITLVFAVIFSTDVIRRISNALQSKGKAELSEYIGSAVTLGLFALCVMNLFTASYNPFIYFRF